MLNGSNDPNNVISLFDKTLDRDNTKETEEKPNTDGTCTSFEEVMRRNKENSERLKKERLKANQLVLKSYRIKN